MAANTIPLTILVDTNGRVLERVRGAHEWDNPKTISATEKVSHLKQIEHPMFSLHLLTLGHLYSDESDN